MRNLTKYLLIFIPFLMVCLSCSEDNIDKRKISGFANVYTNNDGQAEYFVLDDYSSLYVVKSQTDYKPQNPRVFIQYTSLSDNYAGFTSAIELNGYLYDILTKSIDYISPSDIVKQDSIGYAPVDLVSGFARGNYITLRFTYKLSGDKYQLFSLLRAKENVNPEDHLIDLEFRHNIMDDKENYTSQDIYMCFDIRPYLGNRELVFNISWTDYDGENHNLQLPYNK